MTLALELIGIMLAIIDFSGKTQALETRVDAFREKLTKFLASRRYKKFKKIAWVVTVSLSLLMLAVLLIGISPQPIDTSRCGRGLDAIVCTFVLTLAGTLFYYVALILGIIIATSPVWLFLLIRIATAVLALLLRLLDKPKAGTVGTLGLVLAIGGFIYGHYFAP